MLVVNADGVAVNYDDVSWIDGLCIGWHGKARNSAAIPVRNSFFYYHRSFAVQ